MNMDNFVMEVDDSGYWLRENDDEGNKITVFGPYSGEEYVTDRIEYFRRMDPDYYAREVRHKCR